MQPQNTYDDEMIGLNATVEHDERSFLQISRGIPHTEVNKSLLQGGLEAPSNPESCLLEPYPESLYRLDRILRGEQQSVFVDELAIENRAARRKRTSLLRITGDSMCGEPQETQVNLSLYHGSCLTGRYSYHFLHTWFMERPANGDRCESSLLRQQSIMDIIKLVLVPEVLVFRIMEKHGIDRDQAIRQLEGCI